MASRAPFRTQRSSSLAALAPRAIAAGGSAVLLGIAGGAIAQKHSSYAVLLCVCIAGLGLLATLGDRAFPWAVIAVAVAPWYPLISEEASAPIVKQKVLCAAIAAAVIVPWLWSIARGRRVTRPNQWALLLGVLYGCFAVVIVVTLGSLTEVISSIIVGFLMGGVAFLCARRFADVESWPAAAFGGMAILALLGLYVYMRAPANRVGYFVGYPITYGAIVVGLAPPALIWAWRRWRPAAVALAIASVALLILSRSRSSWVAAAVLLLIVVALMARRADFRSLLYTGAAALLVVGAILATGSLGKVIERKLGSKLTTSQSYTHRLWSYGYALKQVARRPLFGAGAPGFAAKEAANRTSIGAIDNGYLSISVDMGLIGLLAVLVPILTAVYVLARCLRLGLAPPVEVSLALGVIGMAVVTVFYDSFYWASIDLLLGGMGGVLSVRMHTLARTASGS